MSEKASFKQYYETELKPVLQQLESKRKAVLRNVLIAAAVILAVAALIAVPVVRAAGDNDPLAVIGLLAVMAIVFVSALLAKGFVKEFKGTVIGRVVSYCDPSLSYHPQSCVTQAEFQHSGLFKRGIDRYRGEDLVTGKLDATAVRFSEIHAEYKTTTRSSKGGTQTRWHTIFKGLFFIADFNKNFKGRTVVLPDTAQKLFGRLGQSLQSMNLSRADLVKMEDPDFEREFVVYGTDQVEARYILSTSLMQRILAFRREVNLPVYIAFVSSSVHLAIDTKKNMFEPRLFRTLLDYELVREYLEDLQLATGIVEDLNLNTRIWTKE